MKEHQRYFPVYKDNSLTNHFIVVANSTTNSFSKIIKGNQKVLRARLSDGLFFWNNDLKKGLSNNGLEDIVFVKGLGSLLDKVKREQQVATILYENYKNIVNFKLDDLLKAIEFSKSDLLGEMVFEFTELQGVMGGYYAKEMGMNDNISTAIKEQYLPKGEDSKLPSNLFSAIVALSNKIDTLIGLFSLNMIPTGSKDPFALRRAVNGIIQIVLKYRLDFDVDNIFIPLLQNYQKFDLVKLKEFIIDRFNKIFNTNPSIIKAVVESNALNIIIINDKILALDAVSKSDNWKNSVSLFKRVADITKDTNENPNIEKNLFIDKYEKELFDKYTQVISKKYKNYSLELDSLMSLSPYLKDFFDNVMVNIDNDKIKNNRKNLIYKIYKSFYNIADISLVTT